MLTTNIDQIRHLEKLVESIIYDYDQQTKTQNLNASDAENYQCIKLIYALLKKIENQSSVEFPKDYPIQQDPYPVWIHSSNDLANFIFSIISTL